jgi:O-antigen/teichoic acid export membrane protein
VAGLVLEHAEKLFLTRFVSVTTLAYYAIAFTLAGSLALVPGAMRQSLFPAFSRLQAESDRDSLKRLYVRVLRGTLLWIAPAAFVLCALAKPFLTLWVGPEFGRESSLPFYILVGGLMFNAMAFVPHALLIGLGRSDLIARIHLAEVLPYLLCAGALTYWLGAPGAALAWSLRVVADALLLFISARRIAGIEFSTFPIKQRGYALAVAALLLPVPLIVGTSLSLSLLISATALSPLIYAGIIWKRVLTDAERAWVSGMLLLRGRHAFGV